jgi:hypothetical protein
MGDISPHSRARTLAVAGLIAPLGVLFLYLLIRSRHWEYEHDTPLLQYCGFLMARYAWMPYRDFFETSMPGTFLFHEALVRLFGEGDRAFMIVNDCLLGVLLWTSYSWMQRLSQPAAALFVCWYGAQYLASGPSELMQRDWLTIIPIAVAFAIMSNPGSYAPFTRAARACLIGCLIGACACIKPQLSLSGALIIVGLHLLNKRIETRSRPAVIREFAACEVLPAALGFALPLTAVATWLASRNSLASFWWMIHEYLPLHIQQTNEHAFLPPQERLQYVLETAVQFNQYWPLVLAALVGLILIDRQLANDRAQQILFRLAFGMLLIYGAEPALSGQFWTYHYDPFQYWLVIVLSSLTIPILGGGRNAALPTSMLLCCVGFSFWRHHVISAAPAEHGAVADMAREIEKHVPPGLAIQPIDWSTGAVQALLRTRHPIGTHFLYDYHFYHHVQTSAIRELKTSFITQLVTCQVPFVLQIRRQYEDTMTGINTSERFDELNDILKKHYESVHEGLTYRLLRSKAFNTSIPRVRGTDSSCDLDHAG